MTSARATALLLVDHGSVLHEANVMLEQLAALLQSQRPELIVRIAHMERAEPTIEQGIASCVDDGATEIIVHPFMLSPGRHATQDIPRLVSEQAPKFPGVPLRVSPPLGVHHQIGQVILERTGLL